MLLIFRERLVRTNLDFLNGSNRDNWMTIERKTWILFAKDLFSYDGVNQSKLVTVLNAGKIGTFLNRLLRFYDVTNSFLLDNFEVKIVKLNGFSLLIV